MKKITTHLLPIIAITIFYSCTAKIYTLKGNYEDKPFEIISEKKVDVVWSNIIDLFATKGLSIKVIDKNSGLIVSEKTSLIQNYTFEDGNGRPKDKTAFVVLGAISYGGSNINPDKITGEWNVRIKEIPDSKTSINVNLTNIDATRYIPASQYNPMQNLTFQAKSTGKFEEIISNIVK